MTFTVLLFSHRKQGTTPPAFKTHYETIHIPLIQSLTGPHFPLSHKRTYIPRSQASNPKETANASPEPPHPATVLAGSHSDVQYDAIAELTFDNEAAFQTLMGIVGKGEVQEKLAADEEIFMDRARTTVVVVEEPVVTRAVGGSV